MRFPMVIRLRRGQRVRVLCGNRILNRERFRIRSGEALLVSCGVERFLFICGVAPFRIIRRRVPEDTLVTVRCRRRRDFI
ncbi:hypothetical protein [Thermoflavimicrobium daqui]|uniref:hypothetical protein n=1 Tax=Thermoflavimicrobium daqui TaxID=2137476 RepID=UPI0011AB2E55|nr:hypothetical protein [Thermoflavimicrobium daqui]